MMTDIDDALIELALLEDLGPGARVSGDITTSPLVPLGAKGKSVILAKESLVCCGNEVAARVFERLDPNIRYQPLSKEGERRNSGEFIAEISGSYAAILAGERVALNFLQRLSGIATETARFNEIIKGTTTRLLDTRKTTPGMRSLEKYAVRTGGGKNHRMGLYDQVLIKNNHVDFFHGDLAAAVAACRDASPTGTKIQIEVRDEDELVNALLGAPDSVLLDNMPPERIKKCLNLISERGLRANVEVEASGGINESTLRAYAETGVDFISLGALTHSVKSSDISLRFVES